MNKANLIGKTLNDSVVIDYTDKTIITQDSNGNVTEVRDSRWMRKFYETSIKSLDPRSERSEILSFKSEIEQNDELTSSDKDYLIGLIHESLGIKSKLTRAVK